MKVEKDLGFVNEIPVYVNGKASKLRVGEYAYDDAVEEVLENTKESFQKPLTVAGQARTCYVVGIQNSTKVPVNIAREGKSIDVYLVLSFLPKEFASDSANNIKIEFVIPMDGEIYKLGFAEFEQMGAQCEAYQTTMNGIGVIEVRIDFSQLSEATEEEIEEMKEMLKLYDVLRVKAEKVIKENMLITVQED